MTGAAGLLAAFAAGIVSFLSPCILPLVPGYLSVVTGLAAAELAGVGGSRRVIAPIALFVSGFSVVFIALGASASVLGAFLAPYRDVLSKGSGVLVAVMGLLLLGVVKVPWLYGEARADMSNARSFGRAAAFVMGMAFAFGWTPCVGPVLASILVLAGSAGDVGRGAALLTAYSAGLAVPFVLVGLLFGRMRGVLKWLGARALLVNRVAGAILVGVGVLISTGAMRFVSAWLLRSMPFLRFG